MPDGKRSRFQRFLQSLTIGHYPIGQAQGFYPALGPTTYQQLGASRIPPPPTNDAAIVFKPNALHGVAIGRDKLVVQYGVSLRYGEVSELFDEPTTHDSAINSCVAS